MDEADDDAPALEEIADFAWILRYAPRPDDAPERDVNERVHAAARALRAAALPGVVDIVPAYASLAVVFDEPSVDSRDALAERVFELASAAGQGRGVPRRTVTIPVAYGGEHGPDLDALARRIGLGADEIVRRHAAGHYVVGMLGFLPGFPYLIGLDPSLNAPRHATPRTRVPAGSVGIGGGQTGVYPIESPGGWQLIGRTNATLFDPRRSPPALLEPGDAVRFAAVEARALARAEVSVAVEAAHA